MLADRREAVNSQRHSGQIWRKGISDLSIICLGMIDGQSDFFQVPRHHDLFIPLPETREPQDSGRVVTLIFNRRLHCN